ncbi:uncharacterized protein B0T15DRAFT_193844 [Chaetomium strumarium]|uniref:Uncharacterized protein n=1 Tax=Chaetomium strumarium TaxID=1170767 RepID=A0AAJ0M1B5_9PEZI|nr:hypothetical protein B0T15DRAFT_193844 [Chaetomium strumarium]
MGFALCITVIFYQTLRTRAALRFGCLLCPTQPFGVWDTNDDGRSLTRLGGLGLRKRSASSGPQFRHPGGAVARYLGRYAAYIVTYLVELAMLERWHPNSWFRGAWRACARGGPLEQNADTGTKGR